MSRLKYTVLSSRVKNIREGFGLTKASFAKQLCISAAYVTDLESGKNKKISKPLAKLISHEFNINTDWLLTGEGDMYRSTEATPPPLPGVNEAQPDHETPKESQAAITEDYPLIKKLMNEAEDAARRGLSEEELTDLLMTVLEGELIKQRRRPAPYLEDTLLDTVRDILTNEVPPEDTKERRKCMIELSDILKMKSNDEASRRV